MKNFTRYEGNPIISPRADLPWQQLGVYNPGAIFENGKVHLLFRARSAEKVSVLGYASSSDGYYFDGILDFPVYTPREDFEKKIGESSNAGCEDPRITKIDDRFIMTYTAYDGTNPPRVALTSIAVSDFLEKNWNWDIPRLISPPGVDDKDACIFRHPDGRYFAFHRIGNVIWIDTLRDLSFPERKFLTGGIIASARKDKWDNIKVGIAAPPLLTDHGWVLFYHALCGPEFSYKIGAMLLNRNNPKEVLARTNEPLLTPEMPYEKDGQVSNVVFSCGAVLMNDTIFLYYGGADTVICVATMPLPDLLETINEQQTSNY